MENLASQYTVLVVDDVPTNVMLVQAILKKEGYTLLTTDSGAKALRIAQERHPNLILLDIMMPEMDGYEVLQHLKSNPETNNIPVIIMSALSDMQSIVKGYQLGATEYVTIVNSTAEIFIPMATQKGISIMLEGLDKELMGSTDIDMVKTIVRNLISNAVKFSYEKGLITVSTKTDGDFVVVSVKDSGKGIKKEDQGKLLRPNTHFTSYGTNNEKGSGLGLMLCKDFVEQLGGKLWFDSEEGKGTTFYFSLKVSNQE